MSAGTRGAAGFYAGVDSVTTPSITHPPASLQSSAIAPGIALPPASLQSSAIAPGIALPPASLQSLDPRFVAGVKYLKAKNFSAALSLFAAADVGNSEDSFSNLYIVFHGLTRLYLGDESGLSLCRRAAYFESYIAEVHYRHAVGELKMRHRYHGVCAVKAGLAIDPGHRALRELREDLGVRQGPVLGFLSRDHILNRLLGRVWRRPRVVSPIFER